MFIKAVSMKRPSSSMPLYMMTGSVRLCTDQADEEPQNTIWHALQFRAEDD